MGLSSSTARSQPSSQPSQQLVLYDNMKAREARQHISSDFVNAASLVDHLQPGDMIQKKGNWIYQWFYSHFAIYIGNGEIVHVDSVDGVLFFIRRVGMVEAFDGELVRKNNHLDNAPNFCNRIRNSREIVKVARDADGQCWDYSLFSNNCEHFATWCRYGRAVSLQTFGICDWASGNITFDEYIEYSAYRIREKATTFYSWIKRKTMGFFDSIGSAIHQAIEWNP